MWLLINNTLKNDQILLSAGKSLCICQKFETTCKDILMLLSCSKFIYDKRGNLLSDEYIKNFNDLIKRQLGDSIVDYKKDFAQYLDPSEIEILTKGKNSRNYICHDLLKDLIIASFSEKSKFIFDDKEFKAHLKNIALADYMVSKWSYEFQEQSSGDFYDKEKYVKNLINWVMS